jgi:FHA domain
MSKVSGKGRARGPSAPRAEPDAREKGDEAAPAGAAPTISTPPPPAPAAPASSPLAAAAPEPAPVAKGGVAPSARQRSKSGVVIAPAGGMPAARTAAELYTLHVLRSLGGGPGRYAVGRRDTVIGAAGEISLPGETFCHPREAMLKYREGRLFVERLEGNNGVFLRIQKPVVMGYGEEFIVGDQLLRVEENPLSDDAPDPDPTYFSSSPRWPSAFRVVQILAGGARGACLVARGSTLQVGSVIGDLILSGDPLVDAQHCLVEEQASSILLTDLESRNGVFVRTRGRQELVNGDEIVIGRTHLVVDIEPQATLEGPRA